MQLTPQKTVAEIAVLNPSSVRVFESLGIDYCCGGRMSLQDSCARADLDLNRVVELLEKADDEALAAKPVEWNNKTLSELTAYIVDKHHKFVRQETPRIEALLSKVAGKHGPAHPELREIEQLFNAIARELSTHMMKEEQILFPFISRLEQAAAGGGPRPSACFGNVQQPIATMMAEHDDAGALLAKIRQLSNGYAPPEGACTSFIAMYRGIEEFERDLHQHVHLENNILFPRVIELER
jgi:regulator of cell morphogenesis and NO signaling